MLRVQRAAGLLLVALGGAAEASALFAGLPSFDAGSWVAAVPARCAAVFGAALYALTMTGRLRDALPAVLPVPVLAPLAAVLLSGKRGDLSRPAPAARRLVRFGEGAALALALTALGGALSAYGPALLAARAAAPGWVVTPAPGPVEPAAPAEPVGAISYEVGFRVGTAEMTEEGRSILSRVADTMHYYPLDDLLLSAATESDDADAAALALARLEAVRRALVDRGLKDARIQTRVRAGAGTPGTVDLLILSN